MLDVAHREVTILFMGCGQRQPRGGEWTQPVTFLCVELQTRQQDGAGCEGKYASCIILRFIRACLWYSEWEGSGGANHAVLGQTK